MKWIFPLLSALILFSLGSCSSTAKDHAPIPRVPPKPFVAKVIVEDADVVVIKTITCKEKKLTSGGGCAIGSSSKDRFGDAVKGSGTVTFTPPKGSAVTVKIAHITVLNGTTHGKGRDLELVKAFKFAKNTVYTVTLSFRLKIGNNNPIPYSDSTTWTSPAN